MPYAGINLVASGSSMAGATTVFATVATTGLREWSTFGGLTPWLKDERSQKSDFYYLTNGNGIYSGSDATGLYEVDWYCNFTVQNGTGKTVKVGVWKNYQTVPNNLESWVVVKSTVTQYRLGGSGFIRFSQANDGVCLGIKPDSTAASTINIQQAGLTINQISTLSSVYSGGYVPASAYST